MADELQPLTAGTTMNQVSAIVPIGERRSNLSDLYTEYRAALAGLGLAYEIIFVLDGPNPGAMQELSTIQSRGADDIVVIRLARFFGEATALMAGVAQAGGDIILT